MLFSAVARLCVLRHQNAFASGTRRRENVRSNITSEDVLPYSHNFVTLSKQSDVLRCCLPDETHSEQLISSALTRFSLKWPSLNCLMYEGAVYQPDETHSEQLLSSALTRFSLRWPSLNCLMYEGAVYQMRPIQNSSSFLLCSPECLHSWAQLPLIC